jgi:putative ABC transport system permease protein
MRDWQAFVRARLHVPDLTPEREARVIREVASQLEDFYRDAVARGATEQEADAHAGRQIADWARLARDVRRADRSHVQPRVDRVVNALEARPAARPGGRLMAAYLVRDVRYTIRQLLRAPGFTTVALLTLALGIGATTAVFSVVDGVLLRPLPYPEPDALVRVHEVVPQLGLFSVAPANFFDWRSQNAVFDRLAAYTSASATLVGPDGPERIQGMLVSWDLFPALRTAPAIGTMFTKEEDQPGGNRVVMLSHGLWLRRFGGNAGVVGTSVTLSGAPTTIVGVMPAEFYFPTRAAEFWQPIALDPANATRGGHFLGVVARMKSGVTVEQAQVHMRTLAERLARQYPVDSAGESARVVALQEQVVGAIRPALLMLFAAVGVVVLIVCANVANLLLVRASVREKEMAIRAALGASHRRLLVQVFSESLVLALVGGGLGVLLGYLAIGPIKTLSAGSVPRVADVGLDGRVLAFAVVASMLTGLLFGLAPAWQATRTSVSSVLKQGGRSSSTSGGRWVRSGLLVAEVALSIVLLTGATLLLRSFAKVTNVDPGFNPDRVLAFQVSLPAVAYTKDPQRLAFYDALLGGLESQAGVESAGLVQTLPLRGDYRLGFSFPSRAPYPPGQGPSANYRSVSPRYFDALSIPIVRGRAFTPQDSASSQQAAIVDASFARTYFPGTNPIGQQLQIENGGPVSVSTIVGVVGDVLYRGLDVTAGPTMYKPFAQDVFSTTWVLVHAKGTPAAASGAARDVLHHLDASLPAFSMNPLTTIVSDSVSQRRFSMLLLGAFAVVALFLAAVGLYGVVAYSVSLRTREIGLRMAIGARPSDVLGMVVGGGMKLAVAGVLLGSIAAVLLARLVQTMLFDVSPTDPASYALTALALLVVAAVACYVPARRAMRVDPIVALQTE